METTQIKSGIFVVLESLDGGGKTTQARLLYDYFLRNGEKAELTKEPTSNIVGAAIRSVLLDDSEVAPETLALMFATDRHNHIYNPKNGINKQLAEGINVVCDRYFLSSYAYQTSQGIDNRFITRINSEIIKPDVTIFIQTGVDSCLERIKIRPQKDIFETEEFLTKVYYNYVEGIGKLSRCGWNIHIVNGNRPIEQVHESIIQIADNYLE